MRISVLLLISIFSLSSIAGEPNRTQEKELKAKASQLNSEGNRLLDSNNFEGAKAKYAEANKIWPKSAPSTEEELLKRWQMLDEIRKMKAMNKAASQPQPPPRIGQ